MSSLFNVAKKWESNPSTTPVGKLIDQATDASLASENWSLNMEICDLINESEDTAKDAFKAIRKRLLTSTGKNNTVIMYTLIVLETCVKNCGRKFHTLVCSHDFISDLVKFIGPKNEVPTAIQDKVLGLIQCWSDAFRNQPDCQGVTEVYRDLKSKGIEFPMTDLDCMAPIHTPTRSVKEVRPPVSNAVDGGGGGGGGVARVDGAGGVAAASSIVMLGPEQLGKLKKDLDVVETNMAVFGEMLTEMKPQEEHPSDWQLLQELNSTCKEMQERLVELIPRLANDELTADLLRINDTLNILFLRYSRYEKKRDAVREGRTPAEGSDEGATLIDLTDSSSSQQLVNSISNLGIGTQLAGLPSVPAQSGGKKESDEFDMFAQSRNTTQEQSKPHMSGSTYESNRKPDQVSGSLGAMTEAKALGQQIHKESDFDEMAAWLGQSGVDTPSILSTGGAEESMTSSEFDRFLAERAAVAESMPTTDSPSRQIQ